MGKRRVARSEEGVSTPLASVRGCGDERGEERRPEPKGEDHEARGEEDVVPRSTLVLRPEVDAKRRGGGKGTDVRDWDRLVPPDSGV